MVNYTFMASMEIGIASVAKIGTNTTLPDGKSGVILWSAGEISKS